MGRKKGKKRGVYFQPLTFLSGIILTLCTCPVVSKICRKISSVTRGSRPPTYKALLFGSGAARRTKPPALVGDIILPDMGEVIAVGIGFVFCGIATGGRGGGGICDGVGWPFPWASNCCWPGAPAEGWGGGGSEEEVVGGAFSAIVSKKKDCRGKY